MQRGYGRGGFSRGGRGGFTRGGRGGGRGGSFGGFGNFGSGGGSGGGAGSFERRSQNVNIFFSNVPLNVDKAKVRQHFESIGHVNDFRIFDPKPGIDYRHGLVEYMDERTAAEAISRLNGTAFGDKAMRVAEAKERGKDFKVNFNRRGRGGYEERRREAMAFPRGFQDPALGRGESAVLDVLKAMTTEDAYEAVEQLRVLALERRPDARAVLLENPALRSAVVMILQHAGRLPMAGGGGGTSSLPPEAYQGSSSSLADGGGASAENEDGATDEDGHPAKRAATEAAKDTSKAAASAGAGGASDGATTDVQRDEVIQILSAMSEADVDRVLNLTAQDLADVPDPAERRQLEVLRDRLIEMSSEL